MRQQISPLVQDHQDIRNIYMSTVRRGMQVGIIFNIYLHVISIRVNVSNLFSKYVVVQNNFTKIVVIRGLFGNY